MFIMKPSSSGLSISQLLIIITAISRQLNVLVMRE